MRARWRLWLPRAGATRGAASFPTMVWKILPFDLGLRPSYPSWVWGGLGHRPLIPGLLTVIVGKLLNHFCLFICKMGQQSLSWGFVRTEMNG